MKGFENSKDINSFMKYLTKSKQLTVLKNTTILLRKYFPDCDYYLALMNSKSNRQFLSVGSKKNNAIRATSTVFRFKPSLDSLHEGSDIVLDFNLDKPEKNTVLRQEVTENKGLQKLKVIKDNKTFYRINLNSDLTELENILKIIEKSKLIVRSMTGNGYFPDDYLSNTDNENSTVKSAPQSRAVNLKKITQIDYPRDPKLRINYLTKMNHRCELDNKNFSFISKETNQNYVEAHHLIPISKYSKFKNELDREENLVSLCPNCHRLLHRGINEEVKPLLSLLYNYKIKGLKMVGLDVSLDELLGYYS
jgi:5-methylcytosine-specific restriction protein A